MVARREQGVVGNVSEWGISKGGASSLFQHFLVSDLPCYGFARSPSPPSRLTPRPRWSKTCVRCTLSPHLCCQGLVVPPPLTLPRGSCTARLGPLRTWCSHYLFVVSGVHRSVSIHQEPAPLFRTVLGSWHTHPHAALRLILGRGPGGEEALDGSMNWIQYC